MPNALKRELRRVRERGYATCGQEQEIGLSSIAVPVFNRRKTVAALAVAGPTTRLSSGVLPGILAALQAASTNISRQLA